MAIILGASLDNGLVTMPKSRPAVARSESVTSLSIGQYLIRRLSDYGIRHVFGLPGDYVLAFYSMLEHSPLDLVNCTREDCAGFAADAYARVNGMGAVCVTYGVGGLSLANSIAGAYAEKSPVVLISGAPGLGERVNDPLLHHRVREWRTQLDVFENICAASREIIDPATAFRDIDFLLDTAHRQKRPVYIELPRDIVGVVPDQIRPYTHPEHRSDPDALAEAVKEAMARIAAAQKPVIIAGIELHRFGLQAEALALAEISGIPIAATMLGNYRFGVEPREPFTATGDLTIEKSRFVSSKIFYSLGGLLKLPGFEDISFSTIRGPYRMQDTVFYADGITFDNPLMNIRSTGTIGPASKLDLQLRIEFLQITEKIPLVKNVMEVFNKFAGKLLQVKVEGTISEPKLRLL